MATAKKTIESPKLTLTQARTKISTLEEKLEKIQDSAWCYLCPPKKGLKNIKNFYVSTDPMALSGYCPICKDCARKIALRVDKNGEEHEPTKESVQLALKYLNKPFLNSVWEASIQESENLLAGKVKTNVWTSYIKNIAMINYVGMTYFDSDMFKTKVVYEDEKTERQVVEEHNGLDTYDDFVKNKEDVKRLLSYDPFESEPPSDQPVMYANLLGLLDQGGDQNDDYMRTSACISIVRNFSQISKLDNTITKLMSDYTNIEKNSATIRSLQDSKQKISTMTNNLAADNCISLRFNKNAKKGENTWTGKIKKIKDLNLRDGQVNGFDIATCRGMQQVQEISDASILKQLALDESDWSDMVAEMRKDNTSLRKERDAYKEVNRIILQENLDLKDYLEDNQISTDIKFKNLKDIYSVFSEFEEDVEVTQDETEEVDTDESDNTSV